MNKRLSFILLIAILLTGGVAKSQSNLFFVFLNTNPDREQLSDSETESLQKAHLANIDRLAEEGIMKAAGPFEGGGGMFILNAEDTDAVNEILRTDPAIRANRFTLEVFPLMLANNDLCGAEKPYEMVTYQFVRTLFNVEYFGDPDYWFAQHRVFMANLNNNNDFVIAQGNFTYDCDGFLILDVADAETAEKIIKKHPCVKEGQLNYEIKTLWIAKGTFCKR